MLWAFAVAQPLLDLLGDNPDFFVARGNTRGDIVRWPWVLTLAPPLAMLALEALAALTRRELRDGLHLALVGAARGCDRAAGAGRAGRRAGGAADRRGGCARGRGPRCSMRAREWLPSLLTVLSPAPVLFVCLFLFFSDTKELVLPEDEVEAAEIAVPGRTPVVVIVLDEFQGTMLLNEQGRIDRTLFPNFAELADRGACYPNATTEADLTPRAAPAVMTGSTPTHDELPTAADHPDSIFTLLGADYAMNVAEPVTSVCPESLCGDRARPPASDRLDGLASDLRIVYEHLLLPTSLEDSLPAVDETFSGFGQAAEEQAEGEVQGSGRRRGRVAAHREPAGRRETARRGPEPIRRAQRELPGARRHLRGAGSRV